MPAPLRQPKELCKPLLVLLSLQFFIMHGFSQGSTTSPSLQWSQEFGINGQRERAVRTLNDPQGNVIMLDEAGDDYNILRIAKYDPAGTLLWQRTHTLAGPYHFASMLEMDIDAVGNIYIGAHVTIQSPEFLLMKYSSGGTKLWSFQNEVTTDWRTPQRMKVDAAGNCYVAFSTRPYQDYVNVDPMICKYNTQGVKVWTYVYAGNTKYTSMGDLAVDANGNSYLTTLQTYDVTGGYSQRALTLKVASSGTLVWARTYTTGPQIFYLPKSIRVTSGGDAYVLMGSGPASNSYNTLTTIKYNSAGTWQWVKSETASLHNETASGVDASGNFLLAFKGNDGRGKLVKYSGGGVTSWSILLNDTSTFSPRNLRTDGAGNVYTVGSDDTNGKIQVVKANISGVRKWTVRTVGTSNAPRSAGVDLTLYPATSANPYVYVLGHSLIGGFQGEPGNLLLLKYVQPPIGVVFSGLSLAEPATNQRFAVDAFPNPFKSQVTLRYSLPENSHVDLLIFDGNGRLLTNLVNAKRGIGDYNVSFDPGVIPSQPLYYTINAIGASRHYTRSGVLMLSR